VIGLITPAFTFLLLFATTAPAAPWSVELDPKEREQTLKSLFPSCKAYYDARARCLKSGKAAPDRIQRELDQELVGLAMLSSDRSAAEKCGREYRKLREAQCAPDLRGAARAACCDFDPPQRKPAR
jgi:hypothetical protein